MWGVRVACGGAMGDVCLSGENVCLSVCLSRSRSSDQKRARDQKSLATRSRSGDQKSLATKGVTNCKTHQSLDDQSRATLVQVATLPVFALLRAQKAFFKPIHAACVGFVRCDDCSAPSPKGASAYWTPSRSRRTSCLSIAPSKSGSALQLRRGARWCCEHQREPHTCVLSRVLHARRVTQ